MQKALLLFSLLFSITITVSGQVIAKKLPAEQKQEALPHCGHQAIWIKGHWQWDETQQSYQWVKGNCEPHKKGYTYIPGRWIKVKLGWQWQEGTWRKI